MAYSYNSSNFFSDDLEADWNNTDTSQFLWDSPQPESQVLPSTGDTPQQSPFPLEDTQTSSKAAAHESLGSRGEGQRNTANSQPLANRSDASGNFVARSTASENSSQSSSSGSSAKKRKASSTSSPPPPLAGNFLIDEEITSNDFKMDKMFEGSDEGLPFEDNTYPSMGQDMHKLSLNNIGPSSMAPTFDFESAATSPDAMNTGFFGDEPRGFTGGDFSSMGDTRAVNASPQMTVQPSKTFYFGGAGDDSPNSMTMMNSHESSPSAIFTSNSPMPSGHSNLAQTFPNSGSTNGMQQLDSVNFGLDTRDRSDLSPPSNAAQNPYGSWPCQLEVDPTPEKSRVETQIPIKLTLRNAPPGIQRLHLPSHTISKPKFQSKPAFEKSDDTLELSAMLVCASAMEKQGVERSAFERAARDEIYVATEENQPASSKVHTDDTDPTKPLNGGPVAICSGCIVRERKRAARKKTKKADEEEEWAKDEAKRVIVFNCPEVRDWCVPGTKETAVKEHDGPPLDTIFVHAPMRIACYCRHQGEKSGFQVIFTLRMANGTIIAQAMSHSIMITDDHKQPSSGHQSSAQFNESSPMGSGGFFQQGQGVGLNPGAYPQPMPFRNSFSTNDLRLLGNTYSPQRHPPAFSRESSGLGKTNTTTSTATSTATATPRNLSRPASPTNQAPTAKKRRSGGSGHSKVPSGLTMTRMGDMSPSSAGGMNSSGPASAGPMSGGMSFNSPMASGHFAQQMNQYQASAGTQNPFRSGPTTPLHGPGMPTFGNSLENDLYFYSAPTSQRGSRAASPSSGTRMPPTSFPGNIQIPEQASNALARLPPGFNLHRPPIIQRVIPNLGPQAGGDEVTILGTGFFQGLEVMFGDNYAPNTVFWGDTTLVCRSPPGEQPGMVQVMFKHQHQSSDLQQLRGILPTQPVYYEYFDDDRNQLQMLAMDVSSQGQAADPNQMSQDELSRAFLNTSGGFSNYGRSGMAGTQQQQQQRPASAYDLTKLSDWHFEGLLLKWLDAMDIVDSPYQPRYNKKNRKGGTLLSLAAGKGYRRFCAGLLARGADPNPRDRSGYTPLMMASLRKHVQTVQLLLVRGADPTLRTLSGYTVEDLLAPSRGSNVLAAMETWPLHRTPSGARDPPRRPSSTPSVDSISGISTSSQPSNVNTPDDDEERHFQIADPNGLILRNPWGSNTNNDLHAHGEAEHAYSMFQAFAALAAWREQMLAQLQRSNWTFPQLQFPGLPPMPSLPSLPHKINSLDYQQYYDQFPMVRRISDFLSPVPASPPAYEDIFPKGSRNVEDATKELLLDTPRTTLDATGDRKCVKVVENRRAVGVPREMAHSGASFSKPPQSERPHVPETGSLFPWVLIVVALILGVWNYTSPGTCAQTAPLARFKDMLQGAVLTGTI